MLSAFMRCLIVARTNFCFISGRRIYSPTVSPFLQPRLDLMLVCHLQFRSEISRSRHHPPKTVISHLSHHPMLPISVSETFDANCNVLSGQYGGRCDIAFQLDRYLCHAANWIPIVSAEPAIGWAMYNWLWSKRLCMASRALIGI